MYRFAPLWSRMFAFTVAIIIIIGVGVFVSPVAADSIAVQIQDGRTGEAIEGAFVMVGPMNGVPCDNNWSLTDATGDVQFSDPAISGPQTVTAAMAGFAHSTVYEAVIGSITIPLFPTIMDSSMAEQKTRVQGTVSNISNSNNDGFLDVALILPAVSTTDVVMGDILPFSFGNEIVNFPVIGDMELPENCFAPSQVEYYIFTFEKSPWRIDVPGSRTHTFASMAGRISIDDLINGASIDDFQIREAGVERDVYVGGPMNLTINSDLNLSAGVTANLSGVPAGSDLIVTSGAQIPGPERDLVVTYDLKMANIDETSSFEMVSRNPSGDMSDATNLVVSRYSDSASAFTFEAGIIDRSGFSLPYVANVNSWFKIPEISTVGRSFSWEDPTDPGVSPSPTWTRSTLGIRPMSAGDPNVPITREWHLYVRAGEATFDLPILPPEAPCAPGGLTNPEDTVENDQLYWQFHAANPPDDPNGVVNGFMEGGTHWSWRWIPIEFNSADVTDNDPLASGNSILSLSAYPNPGRQQINLSWQSKMSGSGYLEIIGADGRVIRRDSITLSSGEKCWSGRDESGRVMPTGMYWARISDRSGHLQRRPLVWIR